MRYSYSVGFCLNLGRLTLEDIIKRLYTNPRKIFNLPLQTDTHIVVDLDEEYTIAPEASFSKCRWTPYAGVRVRGRVRMVVFKGKTIYSDGRIFSEKGTVLVHAVQFRTVQFSKYSTIQ